MKQKKIIGITGGVGAGKSSVLAVLKNDFGAKIILADLVAHDLMEPGSLGLRKVTEALGTSFLTPDGAVDRKALADLIFRDKEALKTMNSIIHPLVWKTMKEEAEAAKKHVSEIKEVSKALQVEMDQAAEELQNLLYTIPNVPYDEVPEGTSAEDNVVEKMGGMETELPKNALPHWELAKKYDLIDFDLGVKITGAGFPVYKGQGARLQRALINFFLDEARDAGYLEIMPPTVVNSASGYGTGQLPDKEGQMYHCEVDDLYLIPTAEVCTNFLRWSWFGSINRSTLSNLTKRC